MIENVIPALEILGNDADRLHEITKSMSPGHGVVRMTFKRPAAGAQQIS